MAGGPQKPKRNDPCPCGSGKKFKRCHGGSDAAIAAVVSAGAREAEKAAEVLRFQQKRQQGLGRGIVSAMVGGKRLVVVGDRTFFGTWSTFQQFLYGYVVEILGREWLQEETRNQEGRRHPVAVWRERLRQLIDTAGRSPENARRIQMTGAVNALLTFAYDLYTLEHNATHASVPSMRDRLLRRLRDPAQFVGARYEVRVAAMFLRAGFDLEWEDEADGQTTHCEFVATYRATASRFWVECKMRNQQSSAGFGRFIGLVSDALRKSAEHERLVFVDVNVPAAKPLHDDEKNWRTAAVSELRKFEGSPAARDLPRALVVITNFPDHHHLDEIQVDSGAILEGFKTGADYRNGESTTIARKIEQRERFLEVEALLASMKEHGDVPVTFDASIAGLDNQTRLLIGRSYGMDDGRIGELQDACVDPHSGRLSLVLRTPDGAQLLYQGELSADEFEAWKRYPETFFGEMRFPQRPLQDPLEVFDLVVATYTHTPKEKLLEFMSPGGGAGSEELRALTQPELARLYAQGIVNSMLLEAGQPPLPISMRRMRKPPKDPR